METDDLLTTVRVVQVNDRGEELRLISPFLTRKFEINALELNQVLKIQKRHMQECNGNWRIISYCNSMLQFRCSLCNEDNIVMLSFDSTSGIGQSPVQVNNSDELEEEEEDEPEEVEDSNNDEELSNESNENNDTVEVVEIDDAADAEAADDDVEMGIAENDNQQAQNGLENQNQQNGDQETEGATINNNGIQLNNCDEEPFFKIICVRTASSDEGLPTGFLNI